jgi:hypothetical protein
MPIAVRTPALATPFLVASFGWACLPLASLLSFASSSHAAGWRCRCQRLCCQGHVPMRPRLRGVPMGQGKKPAHRWARVTCSAFGAPATFCCDISQRQGLGMQSTHTDMQPPRAPVKAKAKSSAPAPDTDSVVIEEVTPGCADLQPAQPQPLTRSTHILL